ncbi:MAG: DUF86 domain-containing protein [Syntrophobacteraceae bacterium]
MQRDEATLVDIANAARLALDFSAGLTSDEFLRDLKTQSAVLHQLTILGEAVKRLSEGFRARYPDIPWALIAGMRDHLIHAYDAVDLDEVWRTLKKDIPDLLDGIVPILPSDET